MGYFQVRYDSRVVNYKRGGFIRLATVVCFCTLRSFPVVYLFVGQPKSLCQMAISE